MSVRVRIATRCESYGEIDKLVAALVKPRTVTVNDRLPAGNPSGNFTTTYDADMPAMPVSGPTFSTDRVTPPACTETTEGAGFCCCDS